MSARTGFLLVLGMGLLLSAGCTHHTVQMEHKIEPIVATLNVNLRVDRELDEFFDYQQPGEPATVAEPPVPASEGAMP